MEKPEIKKKLNPKIHLVEPKDIVDCWKLLRSSIEKKPWKYPSLRETHEDEVRSVLFEIISRPMLSPALPGSLSTIMKLGKRPIGQIIGTPAFRNLGDPKLYMFIFNYWIEPEFRKNGFGKALWDDYMVRCRNLGVYAWESNVEHDDLKEFLEGYKGYSTSLLYHRMGGRI